MNLNKIAALAMAISCVACVNTDGSNTDQPKEPQADKTVQSQLDRIERAFEMGDKKTACKIQLSLSMKLASYEEISPELLQNLKRVELKCGVQRLSVDLKKE